MATRVLLLEEDATYARELLRGLSDAGMEVTLARDGDAGLARAVAERFDALVVSAELPGINGFRLCGKLRRDPSFVSPIVLMGSERTVGFEEHQKLPTRANQYLRKPVVVAELVAVLERLRVEAAVRPMTQAPPPLPKGRHVPDASAAALAAALERANAQNSLVAQLRKQLEERDQQVSTLTKELAETKRKHSGSGLLRLPSDDPALREQLHNKERELVEVRSSYESEHHALIDLRRAHAALEAKAREAERLLSEVSGRVSQAESAAATAKAERDAAHRRADDYGRRGERQRGELEKAKADLEAANAAVTTEREQTQQLRHALGALQADVDSAGEQRRHDAAELVAEIEQLRARAEQAELAQREARFEKQAEHENRQRVEQQLADALAAAAEKTARMAAEARATTSKHGETAIAEAKRAETEAKTRHSQEMAAVRADAEREAGSLRDRVRALETTETELRAALTRERDRHAEELTRAEEMYVRHMADVQAEQRARDAALAQAQAAREAAEEHAVEAEQALNSLEERLARVKAHPQVSDDGAARLSEERTAAHARMVKLAEQLRSSEARVVELTSQLTRTHSERDQAIASAKQDVTAARDELAATQRAVQVLEDRHAELMEEHKKTREATQKLQARVVELEATVASAEDASVASQRMTETAASVRSQLQGEVASLERKLAAAVAAREGALAKVAAASAELEEARNETNRVRNRAREKSDEAAQRIADTQAKERLGHARAREVEQALREKIASLELEVGQLRAKRDSATQTGERPAPDTLSREDAEHALAAQQARMRSEAASQVAAVRAQLEAQVSALEAQGVELSRALAKSRENLDAERRNRLEEEGQLMNQMEALETLTAAQAARIAELEGIASTPGGQSSALQQELDEAKKRLQNESAAKRAALEQIERDRTLIDQAQTVLAALVGDDEDDDKTMA